MFRLQKLADYAIVLLTHLANREGDGGATARGLAEQAHLPLPTVGKVLKALCRAGLLLSQRGHKGGYRLARAAGDISMLEVIAAIEGPVALTECASGHVGVCDLESCCPVRDHWQIIGSAVNDTLGGLSLADMCAPLQMHAVKQASAVGNRHQGQGLVMLARK